MVDENKEENKEEKQEEQKTGKVEIDTATYIALLDKLDSLEAEVSKKKDPPTPRNVDEVANASRADRQITPEEVDAMKLSQVLPLVFQGVQSITQPLAVKIEELRLGGELDRILQKEEKEIAKLSEDERASATTFEDYKEATLRIAMENPGMSLERAYSLAKKENEPEVKSKKSGAKKQSNLRTILEQQVGERPGGRVATVKVNETRRDDASDALKEMRKKGLI